MVGYQIEAVKRGRFRTGRARGNQVFLSRTEAETFLRHLREGEEHGLEWRLARVNVRMGES